MTDDNIRESAEDAAQLDRLLALVASAPTVSPALERRILADFDAVRMHANNDAVRMHANNDAVRMHANNDAVRMQANNNVQARRWTFARLLRHAADAVWPGAPVWQPACAFALALIVGVGVAAFAPLDIPQGDDASTAAFTFDLSPDGDASQGL